MNLMIQNNENIKESGGDKENLNIEDNFSNNNGEENSEDSEKK